MTTPLTRESIAPMPIPIPTGSPTYSGVYHTSPYAPTLQSSRVVSSSTVPGRAIQTRPGTSTTLPSEPRSVTYGPSTANCRVVHHKPQCTVKPSQADCQVVHPVPRCDNSNPPNCVVDPPRTICRAGHNVPQCVTPPPTTVCDVQHSQPHIRVPSQRTVIETPEYDVTPTYTANPGGSIYAQSNFTSGPSTNVVRYA